MRAGSTTWSDLMMTNFNLLGVAAILSTIIATPVMAQPAGQALAQAAIQARGSYAIYHPNGESRLGPTPPRRREEVVVGRGAANAMALASSFRPSMPGHETATRPWSAPVGHRQPRAADVPTSTSASRPTVEQEDANVDRKMSNVWRRG